MFSYVMFALSAACVVAMFAPRKKSRSSQVILTYYVCGDEPMPTWQRQGPRKAQVEARQQV